MGEPTIAFVIPAFNAGRYIDPCLTQLLKCIRPGDEVIVVDDGSDDDTPVRLAAWLASASGVMRVVRTANQGVSAARNLGLSMVRTSHVLFLDADDEIEPDVLNAARTARWPADLDMIEFDYACHNNHGHSWPGSPATVPRGTVLEGCDNIVPHLLKRCAFYVWIRLFRVAFLRELPHPAFPRSGGYQDITAVMLMGLRMRRMQYIGGVLVRYRLHEANFTRKYAARKTMDLAGALSMVTPVAGSRVGLASARLEYDALVLKTLYWALKDWLAAPDSRLVNPLDLVQIGFRSLLGDADAARTHLARSGEEGRRMAGSLRVLLFSAPACCALLRGIAWFRAVRRADRVGGQKGSDETSSFTGESATLR